MNLLDFVCIGIICAAAYRGCQKGFALGAFDLASWMITLIIGFWLFPHVVRFVEILLQTQGILLSALSFIFTLLIIRVIFVSLTDRLYHIIPNTVHERKANTFFGVIPGLIHGVVYAALGVTLFLFIPISNKLTYQSQESAFGQMASRQFQKIESKLSPAFEKAIKRPNNTSTVENTSNKSIRLNFTVRKPRTRADLETQMLELLNKERKKEGLSMLKADASLTPVARAHSLDMFKRGYFSHISPEGTTPSDRIRMANVPFITAGENLALAQTLNIAHNGLMESPGHRANILRPAFGRVGIGILDGGVYGLMITQNFRN